MVSPGDLHDYRLTAAAPGAWLAANLEPYLRADGTSNWSLMQLERQLRPAAQGRRRGGYLDRRQTPAADASHPKRCRDPSSGRRPWTSTWDLE